MEHGVRWAGMLLLLAVAGCASPLSTERGDKMLADVRRQLSEEAPDSDAAQYQARAIATSTKAVELHPVGQDVAESNESKEDDVVAKASASSFDHRHPVGNATDKDVKTAWRSDSGTSTGEWLQLEFDQPKRVGFLILRENAFSSISRFAIQAWDAKTSGWRDCFQGGSIGADFLAVLVPVTTPKIRLYVHRTAYGSPGINELEVYGE